jgi:hypothetical protein
MGDILKILVMGWFLRRILPAVAIIVLLVILMVAF